MRVVIAPDKFRGSLTAIAAAQAIARGVRRADPAAVLDLVPLADGGEGIDATLIEAMGGTWHEATVSGPLGDPVAARFGVFAAGQAGVVAMAAASGLDLVPAGRRDPTLTSTRGTGELILAALAAGATRLIVGIGGSATNDGGAGMAQAVGFRLLDADGRAIGPGGGALDQLDRIEPPEPNPLTDHATILVASDVSNPLCGPDGASAIYGPQKGATPDQVARLDANLGHLARIVRRDLGVEVRTVPGGGAAGGLGAGLIAFLGATLRPGIELAMETVGLRDRLAAADLCITGEGCLDASTAAGKTVAGVARLARTVGVPAIALAGMVAPGAEAILGEGLAAFLPICPGPATLDRALGQADAWLATAAEQATRVFLAGSRRDRRGMAGRSPPGLD